MQSLACLLDHNNVTVILHALLLGDAYMHVVCVCDQGRF